MSRTATIEAVATSAPRHDPYTKRPFIVRAVTLYARDPDGRLLVVASPESYLALLNDLVEHDFDQVTLSWADAQPVMLAEAADMPPPSEPNP